MNIRLQCMCDGGGSILHTPSITCTQYWPHVHGSVRNEPKPTKAVAVSNKPVRDDF